MDASLVAIRAVNGGGGYHVLGKTSNFGEFDLSEGVWGRSHLYILILLATSPAGAAGAAGPEKRSFGAAFCQLRWQKAAPNERALAGEARQTSQSGVSQQYHIL